MDPNAVRLDDRTIRSLSIAKVVSEPGTINSLDYYKSGDWLVSSSTMGALNVYDIRDADQTHKIYSKSYGTDNAKFTHHKNAILYSAVTEMQGTLCYLSLHDNRHLRYLRGHSKPVCAMDISPIDDAVISGSLDNTVRLWDLRVSECVAKIRYAPTPRPCVAFDPMGVLFALTAPPNVLKLFNLKQLGLGPFDEFCIPILESLEPNSSIEPAQLYATSCTFDPSGCFVMIMFNDGSAYVLDAFTGETRHIFRTSRERRVLDARLGGCFTPDSQYVLMGTETGSIYCWKMETGELVHKWTNIHPGPICCLEFNPAYFNMVASCNHLSMWLSDENKLRDEA